MKTLPSASMWPRVAGAQPAVGGPSPGGHAPAPPAGRAPTARARPRELGVGHHPPDRAGHGAVRRGRASSRRTSSPSDPSPGRPRRAGGARATARCSSALERRAAGDDQLDVGSSGADASTRISGGAPISTVARCRWRIRGSPRTRSAASSRRSRRPRAGRRGSARSPSRVPTARPRSACRARSAAAPAWNWRTAVERLRWVIADGLGRPVVPLEYGSSAVSALADGTGPRAASSSSPTAMTSRAPTRAAYRGG